MLAILVIRGVLWNAREGMWKIYLSRDGICIFFWNAQNSSTFSFSLFLFEFSSRALFLNGRFSYGRLFWNAQFSIHSVRLLWNARFSIHSNSKNGHFKIIKHMKIGHFKKEHVMRIRTKKERNWKCSSFGHFKKICIFHHVINISFTCIS